MPVILISLILILILGLGLGLGAELLALLSFYLISR
jgi:hypothetical protein